MECLQNQTVKDRLKEFIMFKNISTREFERTIDAPYGFIGNMQKSTSQEKIMKISHCYPELNIVWLLTGEGEMLRSEEEKAEKKPTKPGDNESRIDGLLESNRELIAQHSELIRQQGELIEMIKVLVSGELSVAEPKKSRV